jgi:hypothetical protein
VLPPIEVGRGLVVFFFTGAAGALGAVTVACDCTAGVDGGLFECFVEANPVSLFVCNGLAAPPRVSAAVVVSPTTTAGKLTATTLLFAGGADTVTTDGNDTGV